jgi:PAS domain S-box-containing protein
MATEGELISEIRKRERAEEAQKVSQRLYAALVESIDGIIMESDGRTLQTTFVNNAAERLLGYSQEQWLKESTFWLDHLHTDDRDWAVEAKLRLAANLEKGKFEYRMITADNQVVWLRDVLTTDVVEDNSVRLRGVMVDISDRIRLEQELLAREDWLTALFTATPAGLVILDDQLRFLRLNETMARINGIPLEDHLGKSVHEVLPGIAPIIVPLLQRVLESGIPEPALELTGEKAGEPGTLQHTAASYFPLRDKAGRVIGVGALVVDQTERKQAEEARRESEQRFQLAALATRDVIFDWNLQTGYLWWDESISEAGFGYGPEDLKHDVAWWEGLLHPEDRYRVTTKMYAAIEGGEQKFEDEYRLRRADGDYAYIYARAFMVYGEGGKAVRMVGSLMDLTERRRAEEQLRALSAQLRALTKKSEAAKEEEDLRIAQEIHEELGNDLTVLKWDLAEIDKALSESGAAKKMIPVLRKKIQSAMSRIDMTLSRTRRISSELRPSLLDHLGIVETIEWKAQEFQNRTGIICKCSLEDIDLSREQASAVYRIFQEALNNVFKHAKATVVEVATSSEADLFVLTISDNGRGITEREKTDPRSLGLLEMQERAYLLGGKVEIVGIEGRGTEVSVKIPIDGAMLDLERHTDYSI